MKTENLKKFEQWHNNFIHQKGGGRGPLNIKDWFYTVQQRHRDIRKVFGGISKIVKIKFTSNDNPMIDESQVQYYRNLILNYLPNYLTDNKLTHDVFLKSTMPDGMRTSRHIIAYARKITATTKNQNPYYNPTYYIESYVSQLGSIWTANIIKGGTFHVNITTSSPSFVKLGHYGSCDSGSCFAQCGQNYRHKYNLGRSKDSFVILISKNNKDEFNNDDIIARAWGFATNKGKIFNVTNVYNRGYNGDFVSLPTIRLLIKQAFKQITGEDIQVIERKIRIASSQVYFNGEPQWSYAPNLDEYKTIEQQRLTVGRILKSRPIKPLKNIKDIKKQKRTKKIKEVLLEELIAA